MHLNIKLEVHDFLSSESFSLLKYIFALHYVNLIVFSLYHKFGACIGAKGSLNVCFNVFKLKFLRLETNMLNPDYLPMCQNTEVRPNFKPCPYQTIFSFKMAKPRISLCLIKNR